MAHARRMTPRTKRFAAIVATVPLVWLGASCGSSDHNTAAAAKKFIKLIPYDELRREIEIFCELFAQPAVEAGLKKFVESTNAQPYLP